MQAPYLFPIKKILAALTLLMLLIITTLVAADGNIMEIPPLAPEWQEPPPGELLSTSAPQGADGAVTAKAPDGSQIMVVYNYRVSGSTDRDPYYRIFDGQSWTPVRSVTVTPDTDSAQLALTYDAANVAHLIWEEPDFGLMYMRYKNGSWGAFNIIAAADNVFGTTISAWGSQTIDVAWGQRSSLQENPNIYHSRSTDGGATWSAPVPVTSSEPTSRSPQIVHDAGGNVHLVWQETTAAPGEEIRYARGLPWTQPSVISPPSMQHARRPALVATGNSLYMAFTLSQSVTSQSADQWAYFTRCAGNCGSPARWSTPENVSGQPVRVNESAPFDLVSTIARHDGCTYIYYHGFVQSVVANEVIWGVNSCDGWSAGGRDQVTGFEMRGIYPQVVVDDDDIHLVYEWVEGSQHQIYYMHGTLPAGHVPGGEGDIYLPFQAKP